MKTSGLFFLSFCRRSAGLWFFNGQSAKKWGKYGKKKTFFEKFPTPPKKIKNS